jgi:AraC family transcriptional regulator of adaptative response/methylated-DNA-[protein]-cysteine methyltransferase
MAEGSKGRTAATVRERGRAGETNARWQAVLDRDRSADGRFVYSVSTTGVYCRPWCPSRRPLRRHVRFHGTAAEAAREGFRPCRRCRPDELQGAGASARRVAEICRTLERAAAPPRLVSLAARAGLSPSHFHRVFKAATGLTPRAYFAAHRGARVRRALVEEGRRVTDAIYDAGFSSAGRFYESAPRMLGMSPTQYRAGGAGAAIRFAVGECSLGSVLVAQTAKGVCAVMLGDDPEALVRELQDRFPRGTLIGGDRSFERTVAAVVGYIEAPSRGLDLPLDVRGTAFQQRVWRALAAIPAGTTMTYAELAARLRMPHAARAVGSACAANPVAVAIPCHRVVRTDGSLAGYRWGIDRKRALLERERRAVARP